MRARRRAVPRIEVAAPYDRGLGDLDEVSVARDISPKDAAGLVQAVRRPSGSFRLRPAVSLVFPARDGVFACSQRPLNTKFHNLALHLLESHPE